VRNLDEYKVIGRLALTVVGHTAFCDHCNYPVFGRAVYRRDLPLRERARRGWVVLTDAMYLVHGPDGERQVCRPCLERCRFRRLDEDGDGEPTNADEF
jgi:hypothetical protein